MEYREKIFNSVLDRKNANEVAREFKRRAIADFKAGGVDTPSPELIDITLDYRANLSEFTDLVRSIEQDLMPKDSEIGYTKKICNIVLDKGNAGEVAREFKRGVIADLEAGGVKAPSYDLVNSTLEYRANLSEFPDYVRSIEQNLISNCHAKHEFSIEGSGGMLEQSLGLNDESEEDNAPQLQLGNRILFIDGSNVVRSYDQSGEGTLAILLTLLVEFSRLGIEWHAFFDANFRHYLREQISRVEHDLYLKLIAQHRHVFTEVTGGIRADDYLLLICKKKDGAILSNDRFIQERNSDHAWLQGREDVLIKGNLAGETIIVPRLEVAVDLNHDLDELFGALHRNLQATKQQVPA